jgi:predicted PurR-regulated permease PerM
MDEHEPEAVVSATEASTSGGPPPEQPAWVPELLRSVERRLVLVIVVGGVALLGALFLLDKLSGLISILITALFFSFALEPAVGYLVTKRGWRRGAATGAVFLAGLVGMVLVLALVIPAVISGFQQLIDNAPEWVDKIAAWLKPLGIEFSTDKLIEEVRKNAEDVVSNAAGGFFALTSSVLGALFRWSAIGLFLFYFVAEGPKVRSAMCSLLPPERQKHMLFVLDQAIDQTGGYFYSRLLLAIINGTGLFITLLVFDVPFAAPLAVFEGVVASFVPIVGSYIGGAVPVLFAFLTSPAAGIGALAYILIYQQIENFFLSPRLTAKTMALHPAVAFAAALMGGALGGLLFAFLALPAAGVIQAAVKAWGRRYEVLQDELTVEVRDRSGGFLARFRRKGEADEPPDGSP